MRTVRDWIMICDAASAHHFATRLKVAPRSFCYRTAISAGINRAVSGYVPAHGHRMLGLALRWPLDQDRVASVIAGATRPEQIEANAGAGDWRMTSDSSWPSIRSRGYLSQSNVDARNYAGAIAHSGLPKDNDGMNKPNRITRRQTISAHFRDNQMDHNRHPIRLHMALTP